MPRPYPDIVRPGKTPFRIIERLGTVAVDLINRVMFVPAADTHLAQTMRVHEMMHAKHSRAKMPKYIEDPRLFFCYQLVEDVRMHILAMQIGLVALPVCDEHEECRADRADCSDRIFHLLQGLKAPDPDNAHAIIMGLLFNETSARGRFLRSFLARHPRSHKRVDKVVAQLAHAIWPPEETTEDEEAAERATSGIHTGDTSGECGSGHMHLIEPPLEVRAHRLRRSRADETGTRVKNPLRMLTDRRIFARRVRRQAVSVLVDASGSMGWNSRKTDELLEHAPASIIGIYSGRERDGDLVVIARRGSRVRPEKIPNMPGANVIDLPALRWLSRQPEPRVWVSDGQVTGIGDHSSSDLRYACEEVTEAARITRVRSTADLVSFIRKWKAHNR